MTGSAAAYMDDVVIYSKTWREHLRHVRATMSRIQDAGLTLKVTKCKFGMTACEYLGHQVGEGEVSPLSVITKDVCDFKTPRTKKHIRAFLGLSGYYR